MTQDRAGENPLLAKNGLPRFDLVRPEHVVPAVRQMLDGLEQELARIETDAEPTWDSLVAPLEQLEAPFEYTWNPVTHLLNVKNSEPLREAFEEALGDVVAFGLRLRQSRPVYDGLRAIRDSGEWRGLSDARKRVVELRLRDAELAAVGLEGDARKRFNEIEEELSRLANDFQNHLLDATKAFELIVTDPADTDGWPGHLRLSASQSYNRANADADDSSTPEKGPWRITLDLPSYLPFMQHSRRRGQREQVYRAFITRASDGEWDNSPIITRMLELRREQAELLGFNTYAEMSLSRKMAGTVDAVSRMFADLMTPAEPFARRDFHDLAALAKASGQEKPVAHWDIHFWAERLRERRFDFTDEQLRPYFPLPRVLEGLFGLAERLFGVRIEQSDEDAPVWHPDVRYYRVVDDGGMIASFYLDPYSRPAEKNGGAWADSCLDRRKVDGKVRLPVVHLCCNGAPPVGDRPSLMSFEEVRTLFHEFGHGLQAMLTRVNEADVSGINGIEWDAVELASQFMENWCYHKPTLTGMTRHVDTGEPLPDDLFEKLVRARTFRAGSFIMRQLEFGMTDMELHHKYYPDGMETPFDLHHCIASKMSALPPLRENRFLCSFSHIFGGAYAAGYYSYLWAEILSADAFAAFEEAGLEHDEAVRALGRKYRDTILALGGSRHPMEVFKAFRDREPSPDALLRHLGLGEKLPEKHGRD